MSEKVNMQGLLRRFHKAMETKQLPADITSLQYLGDALGLCLALIEEEFQELCAEANELWYNGDQETLEKFVKELTDLLYVVLGTFDVLQVDAVRAFMEVHNSNMSKLDENGKPMINGVNVPLDSTRPHGKILKPKTYTPADVQKLGVPIFTNLVQRDA